MCVRSTRLYPNVIVCLGHSLLLFFVFTIALSFPCCYFCAPVAACQCLGFVLVTVAIVLRFRIDIYGRSAYY